MLSVDNNDFCGWLGDFRQSRPPDSTSAACGLARSATKAGRRKKKGFGGVQYREMHQEQQHTPIQEKILQSEPSAEPPEPAKLRKTSPINYAETERGRPYSQLLGTETYTIQVKESFTSEAWLTGVRVIYIQYLDGFAGAAANSRLFRLKESLGVFTVPASMWQMVVNLESNNNSRCTIASEDRILEISSEEDKSVKHAIEHIYADQDE